MSQILQKRTKKNRNATGVANKLHDGNRNHLTIADVFKTVVMNKPVKNKVYKDGKSKNKARSNIA